MSSPTREPIPPAVRDLIDRCLSSMEHVELILWLAADRDRAADADAAAAQLHTTPDVAAKRLAELEQAGLLARDSAGKKPFRYAPKSVELREAVNELGTMYNQRPVTLVRSIYERPASPVRSFADAFRLRKED